jgi:BlaI family transcriptional regulator, penicillinase repressor
MGWVRIAMERNLDDVTDAELAVLQALWDHRPATIRQITDAVYPNASAPDAKYATVQKLLDRLEEKGHVERDRRQHAHLFTPKTSRDELVGRRLRAMAQELTGGLMAPLLSHLVRAETLSAEERRALRNLLNEFDRKKSPPTNR